MKNFPLTFCFIERAQAIITAYRLTGKIVDVALPRGEAIRNEIISNLDEVNGQQEFDRIKKILNEIDFGFFCAPYGDAECSFFGYCKGIAKEIENVMKICGVKDNYPKKGFLCPADLDDVNEEETTTSEQYADKEKICDYVACGRVFTPREKIGLTPIYRSLVDANAFLVDVTEDEFFAAMNTANFFDIYLRGKHTYIRCVVDCVKHLYPPQWAEEAIKSMGITKKQLSQHTRAAFFKKFPYKK